MVAIISGRRRSGGGGGPVVSWCVEAPEVVTAMGGAGGTKGKAAVSGGY
jgi:hypothetical protein